MAIPTLPERIISQPYVSKGDAEFAQSIGSTVQQIAQLGAFLKQAKDTTDVTNANTEFQLQTSEDWNEFQNTANPETMREDWNKLYKKRQDEFLKGKKISNSAKETLKSTFTQYQAKFQDKVFAKQTELQKLSYANSIEKASQTNNLLAYRTGQDLDLSSLDQIEKNIGANVIAGASIVNPDKLEEMARTQVQGAYVNFIKGTTQTDLDFAKKLVEDEEIQNKLGDVETIDMMRNYIRQVENRQKQLEEDALADEKNLKKASLDVNTQVSLEAEFNKFNIGQKKGRDVIKNKDFNSMTDVISFRDDVKRAYSKNEITDAQYLKWLSDTTPVMINMIEKGRGDIRAFPPFLNNVNEQIAKDIKKQFKDNPAISDGDLVGIYEETYKQLADENIEPTSVNNDDKLKAQELLDKNIRAFSALTAGRTDINATIIGNSIVPLNEEATTKGSQLDNGGFKLEQDINGNRAWVRRDSNGNVLEIKEVR